MYINLRSIHFLWDVKNAINHIKIYSINFTLSFNIFTDTILWYVYTCVLYFNGIYYIYETIQSTYPSINQPIYSNLSMYLFIYVSILHLHQFKAYSFFSCFHSLVVYFFDFRCNLFLTSSTYLIYLNFIS